MSRERAKRITHAPVQENIEKINQVVEDGNYYGAQQMNKTFSARYISADRYSDALDILQSGACLELENGQIYCGAELGLMFVETLVKGKIPYDDDTLDCIRKIYKKFPQISVPQNLDLADDDDIQQLSEALGAAKIRVEVLRNFLFFPFFKAAIKWSIEFGAHRNGSPELYDMLADYLYSESPELDMAKVSYHFVRGKSPKKFAATLVNFMGKCYPGEDDLAVAHAVLMYLSLCNLRDANFLMDDMKKQVQSREVDFPQSELMQFIIYLLQTLQRDALPLFNIIRQRYKSSLDREPILNELLDEVAWKFYGVRRRNSMPGMFGEIFKMMAEE
ncbi:LOW QUALITY PROTEIN: protein GET4-like [Primulina eburnea]|uniref:LOW QUALITY PROTEIN: protein GET4-like n=1 Tax=Primulina eburnea TaxID=1245227 RepID=UPI003C6BE743